VSRCILAAAKVISLPCRANGSSITAAWPGDARDRRLDDACARPAGAPHWPTVFSAGQRRCATSPAATTHSVASRLLSCRPDRHPTPERLVRRRVRVCVPNRAELSRRRLAQHNHWASARLAGGTLSRERERRTEGVRDALMARGETAAPIHVERLIFNQWDRIARARWPPCAALAMHGGGLPVNLTRDWRARRRTRSPSTDRLTD
jgi:hypothetical protein